MFETQRRKGQRSTADMDDLDDVAAEQAPGEHSSSTVHTRGRHPNGPDHTATRTAQ